jgi:hypothetical protein
MAQKIAPQDQITFGRGKSCLLSEIYNTNMVLRIINVCVYFDVGAVEHRA